MNNKFLPLGTVVMLKGGTHRVMIVGYCFVDPEKSERKTFDYIGTFFPEGIFSLDKIMAFNHIDIEKIYFVGYSDEEQKIYNNKLLEFRKKYINDNNMLNKHPDEILFNEMSN